MTNNLTDLQLYFSNKYRTTVKAKLRNVKVNGKSATVTFTEYQAPESDIEKFRSYDGSDGHYYFIVITTDYFNAYYNSMQTISNVYLTSKHEGNYIYALLKTKKEFNFTL